MEIGTIIPWFVNGVLPSADWLWCDGTAYAVAAEPDLFAVIGVNFGSPGPGFFRVPDGQLRMPVGAGTAVALAANDGLVLGARNTWSHFHTAVGNGANSADFNLNHNLGNSDPCSGSEFVDTGGALTLAGPTHVHAAPFIPAHTFDAHQHANGDTTLLAGWPPHQFALRIIRRAN